MTNDQVLGEAVRAMVAQELPDDPETAARAATVARASYLSGASVAEACRRARAFLESWSSHPATATRARRARTGGALSSGAPR
ncbi:MAG TPA: hypothetical protein VE152_07460 [Acidimicrobiales bacterium]|nr:hypothetical protein [Acidimicrobiales bacterium]